jgi:hypothetical protein
LGRFFLDDGADSSLLLLLLMLDDAFDFPTMDDDGAATTASFRGVRPRNHMIRHSK